MRRIARICGSLKVGRFAPAPAAGVLCLALVAAVAADETAVTPTQTLSLFNGRNLDGLYTWQKETGREDPSGVYSVRDGLLRISGEGRGCIATWQAFRDYRLVAEYKWGERTDARDISNQVIGSGGFARVSEKGLSIQGGKPWTFEGKDNNFYVTEHEELFRSIRNGEAINNGDYMAKSTLLAIMARMSAYTGQAITWDQAMSSTEDLSPPSYEWGPLPTPPVAMPGVTKFV